MKANFIWCSLLEIATTTSGTTTSQQTTIAKTSVAAELSTVNPEDCPLDMNEVTTLPASAFTINTDEHIDAYENPSALTSDEGLAVPVEQSPSITVNFPTQSLMGVGLSNIRAGLGSNVLTAKLYGMSPLTNSLTELTSSNGHSEFNLQDEGVIFDPITKLNRLVIVPLTTTDDSEDFVLKFDFILCLKMAPATTVSVSTSATLSSTEAYTTTTPSQVTTEAATTTAAGI